MKDAIKTAVRNFHVPLPVLLYEKLRREAERLNRPATALAREAVEDFLRQRRKSALHEEISAYAAKQAGTDVDLDTDLESASVDFLLDEES